MSSEERLQNTKENNSGAGDQLGQIAPWKDIEKRPPSRTFTDVSVWQKAHLLVLRIYRTTAGFPRTEMFGITTQLRRAAVSVPANFAEGFKKQGLADKIRFLNIAQGSLEECRYYLILSRDLGYPYDSATMALLEEVSRMLESYRKAIARLL